jgi:peptide/nickel transport system permease protein
MIKYIARRLLLFIPVILGVTFIVFTLLQMTPGDPAEMILGQGATPDTVAQLRHQMGLDKPFIVQYFLYLDRMILHQDIGVSYVTKLPVFDSIMSCMPYTVKLALCAIIVGMVFGIPIGIVSAVKQYSMFDALSMILALIGLSMPVFWLGLLLIILFSVQLHWLPASGFDSFRSMILPSLALGAQSVAIFARMTRSSMLEVVRQDYIRTVRAKGQKELAIIFGHTLRNSLIPIITIVGLQFGTLLGGALLTESVFSIPGVGRLMVDSIKSRDYPIVQGGVLFIAICFSAVNLVVDLIYAYVDPRIKSQYK